MTLSERALAVIPARKESKRIPGKNMKMFHGKPIIQWTIEAAIESGLFNKIVVSTDCRETIRLAWNIGIDAIYRPHKLSDDNCPVINVVRHAAKDFRGTVALLYATSPTMSGEILKDACRLFLDDKARPLLSINREHGESYTDAGMFCFYDSDHIIDRDFRFYHVPDAIDINTHEDWCQAEYNFRKENK